MIHSIKNKVDLKDLEELEDLQSTVKQVCLFENLGKQGFHYDVRELFEPTTKHQQIKVKQYLGKLDLIQIQLRIWMNQIKT